MSTSGSSRLRTTLVGVGAAALVLSTPTASLAKPAAQRSLEPHSTFTMAPDGSSGLTASGEDIPNIDSVKSTIRKYYGAGSNGIADKTSSPYISEMADLEEQLLAALPAVDPADHKAVVFDADDTTLWTYDMEDGAMHFNFNPTLQNQRVQDGLFPATPGMPEVVNTLDARGYDIYGITGRTNDQEAATLDNLADEGYEPFTADNFFTKWTAQPGGTALPKPDYVDCTADGSAPESCSTVEYKAFTRQFIESQGEDIVMNVGDQWSDLQGGFSDASFKLPNPTYYLPSPNIAGAPASDADMTPDTTFTMAPDGSSGLSEGGEHIPNIDSVKSTIRTYYNAPSGIADKTSSPYVTEMQGISDHWSQKLKNRCTKAVKKHQKPAVVFDADDTTLMTYDMEDAAMKFNFDPTLQNTWVQQERFPATPGMVKVVRAAAKAGCKIVGLTGRNNAQRVATLDNLAKYYYDAKTDQSLFRSQYYFTKWNSDDTPPAYVTCADRTKCSTIEYKSSTRKYVEDHFGFKILANFGDQFSDLIGGHADKAVKLPNPTYYLP